MSSTLAPSFFNFSANLSIASVLNELNLTFSIPVSFISVSLLLAFGANLFIYSPSVKNSVPSLPKFFFEVFT